ncbi:sensor domain-containing diguanylate cyclase [Acinetobacter tianfuensis]|uniref:diguanylate cyclase n=1 Tax=Acinetobacter tianfuensis TaxID=2419603 RepID=A0A3A8ESV4_9GAMM|nr:diguanylate cyclase [Acinetobacter tianfuensis]
MKRITAFLKLDLQKLILIVNILCVSCLFIISISVVNFVIKEQLMENALSTNQKYASKVAVSTDLYMKDMMQEMAYSANILGENFSNNNIIQSELHRLKFQSNNFNTVSVLDNTAHIKALEPIQFKYNAHKEYRTAGVTESLKRKQTYISPPYKSISNNLIVLMSQPIWSTEKKYLGMLTGSIHLQQKNFINKILSGSYSYKKSYMYVIDQNSHIIFHPDTSRIGQDIRENTGLQYMKQHKSGSIHLVNTKGIKNLAGFEHIPSVNWIVVSQQPTEELLQQANQIIYKTAIGIFIFYLLMFLAIWKITHYISSPLHGLAQMASALNQPDTDDQIRKVNPWYFEVMRFRTALLFSSKKFKDKVFELNQHINTDPLTNLFNRRGMQLYLKELKKLNTEFAVLMIDVDHFKQVNDQWGHDQGDQVLITLAALIKSNFREHDICCRLGGEEFAVLMLSAEHDDVNKAAERLRVTMETTRFNHIDAVTISIGIAYYPNDALDIKEVFKIADNRLYQAKNQGRNQIC